MSDSDRVAKTNPRIHQVRDFADVLERGVSEQAARTPVHVFVMGPSPATDSAGARLRTELIRLCKEEGYSAYAEHPELIQAVASSLGTETDLCTVELKFAASVDILVFIPASPGSYAELGYFAALADVRRDYQIGPRSIVFYDQRHRDEASFLRDGPAKLLREAKATVEFVDYAAHGHVWSLLQPQIEAERRRKVRRSVVIE